VTVVTVTPSAEVQVLKAQFFKALAHPIRIRLLERLVAGEASVQDLQRAVNADQPTVSQQLARLRATGIVVTRKQGTTIYYAVADPMLGDLLLVAKKILNLQLVGVQSLLEELDHEGGGRRRARPARS
jgi:DNA-binding transcriptional ArsR family regulator